MFNDEYVEIYLNDKSELLSFPDKASAKSKLLDLFRSGYGVIRTAKIYDLSEHLWICLDIIKE